MLRWWMSPRGWQAWLRILVWRVATLVVSWHVRGLGGCGDRAGLHVCRRPAGHADPWHRVVFDDEFLGKCEWR